MPREKSDDAGRSNRYSPFDRRSPVAPATEEMSMRIFHSKVVESLENKLQNKELELVSDAETLTADEGCSDSSNDGWNGHESSGNVVPFVYPILQPIPLPRLEPMEIGEPMEIAVDEHPAAVQQVQPFQPAVADENDDDDDDCSESSSYWASDEDEEIQRACLGVTDGGSDEEGGGEYEYESSINGADPSSGRVNRLQFYPELREYPTAPLTQPVASSSRYQSHWQLGQPARYSESSVELMEQDDNESSFVGTANRYENPRPLIEHGNHTQFHLESVRSSMHDSEYVYYLYPRYNLGYEAAHESSENVNFNNNNPVQDALLRHPVNRCNHCGSAIQPQQEVRVPHQPVGSIGQQYLPQFETSPTVRSDFSIRYLLSSDRNRM